MTITYPNGTSLEAILLSHEGDEIRAAAPGSDDVLLFTRTHGTWISERLERVAIEFAWQRRRAFQVPAENECVCPKELAAHMISTLLNGCEPEEAAEDTLFAFNPEGIASQSTEVNCH